MRESLPVGWTTAALADCVLPVASLNPADTPDSQFHYCDISAIDNEAGVVTAPKVLLGREAPSRARQAVRAGDVLFSTVRPGLRAIARVPDAPNPVASTGFCVLRPAEGIDGSLLLHLVRSHDFLQQVLPLQRGVSYPAVRDADVLGQLVPVPPAAEQTRIVAKLEELLSDLDAGVAELKAAQAKLQHYRQSLLKAAVEGALTQAWREANPTPEETGADLLARILRERRARWEAQQLAKFNAQGKAPPNGWKAKYAEPTVAAAKPDASLPETWCMASTELAGDVLLGRQRAPQYLTGRWPRPYLRVANIKDDWIDFSDVEVMDFDPIHFEKYSLEVGDILVSEGQSPELVGQSAIFRGHRQALCFQKTLHRFRALPGVVLPEYAQCVFRAHVCNGVYRRIASITTNIAHLTLEKFEAAPFPLPPLSEQVEIVEVVWRELARVDALEQQTAVALRQSTAQRQNLLRAAFAGQLVPQDPADEPAAELLARIRAERAQQAPVKRRGRRTETA